MRLPTKQQLESAAHQGPPRSTREMFQEQIARAETNKRDFISKLESADDGEIFRFYLLANLATHEAIVGQSKLQAEQSFAWSKRVAVFGFASILVGVLLAILSPAIGIPTLKPAYLATLAGLLVEFISGVFFFLYSSTLKQMNAAQASVHQSQELALAVLMCKDIENPSTRDAAVGSIASKIIERTSNHNTE